MDSIERLVDKQNELEARLEAKKAELRDLATMGAVVTSIHEIHLVLSVVIDMGVRLVNGEVGLILLDEHGELKNNIAWGVDESFIKSLKYEEGMDLATYTFERQEVVTLNQLGLTSKQGHQIDCLISLPIKTSQKCFGVIVIINKADGSEYSAEDREKLEMLMNFVAVAIDNSILIKDKLKQQKTEQEMAIAREVQETILPQRVDDISGIEVGMAYFPAREVGGDFYDVLKLCDTNVVVMIGDVSNKGVPAALVMSAASGIIKSILAIEPQIRMSDLADKTNELLCRGIIRDREMFVTLFFCRFDLGSHRLTYCNAGHLPGLFWDAQENLSVELSTGGPIIGQFSGVSFKEGEREFKSGDRLFLFTDGLTEAADAEGRLFGRERAEQAFSVERGLPPQEFCVRIKEWVDQFTVGCPEESVDDFTVVQIKVD